MKKNLSPEEDKWEKQRAHIKEFYRTIASAVSSGSNRSPKLVTDLDINQPGKGLSKGC